MLRHPQLHRRLVGSVRSFRPQAGAVANAREAVRDAERAGAERRDAAVSQSQALGPQAWTLVQPPGHSCAAPHAVQLYRNDVELGGWLAAYVTDGLVRGEHCVVIATEEHRAALRQRLALTGLSKPAEHLLLDLDAEEVMQRFLRDGQPDRGLFLDVLTELLACTAGTTGRVRAFGEMVGLLYADGRLDAALQLEGLWAEAQRTFGFPLLCAYPFLPGAQGTEHRERIRASHSHLVAAAT